MTTTFRQGQTTYDRSTFTTQGTAIGAHMKRDLTKFMDNPERRDTPFLNSISKGGAVSQIKHEWGLRAVNARGSTVGVGGIDAVVGTTALPVAAGHGVRFQQGHVLRVYAAATPDTFEHFWVTAAPAADTLTIKRQQGGTTATAFAAGAIIKIIGIAMPELTTYPLGPSVRGDLFYNYPQRFMTKVQVDLARENTPDYENSGSWLNYDAAQRTADLKMDLEQALVFGRRQRGTPETSPKEPYMMSGAFHFAELGGNVYDLGGAVLDIEDLEEAGSDLYDLVGSDAGKSLAMSNATRRIFNRLIGIRKYATQSTTTANLTWTSVDFGVANYTFTAYPNLPDGVILIYNKNYISYHPYKGMDWQSTDRDQEHTDGPFIERDILGQFTCEVQAPITSAVIKDFSMDLTAYPALVDYT
jgi:hypothetical protein